MKEKELEKVFKALANKRRILILTALKNRKELSVGDLASEIKLSFRSTSKHLRVLKDSDFVDQDQRSTQVFYKLSSAHTTFIKQILGSV